MLKMIKLTAVVRDGGPTGETGEDDLPEVNPAETDPVVIVNPAETIRSFSPRKGDRPGTRVVFLSGAAVPVAETVEQVEQMLAAAYAVH